MRNSAVRLSSAVSRNVSQVAKWTHATPTHGLFTFQGFPENQKQGLLFMCIFFPFTRKEIPYGILQRCFNWFENDEHFLLWAHKHLWTLKTQPLCNPQDWSLLKNSLHGVHVKVNMKRSLQQIHNEAYFGLKTFKESLSIEKWHSCVLGK